MDDVAFQVENTQFLSEILKGAIYLALIIIRMVVSYFAWRNRPGKGSLLMLGGSLGVLLPMLMGFAIVYWYYEAEYSDFLYTVIDVMSFLTEAAFVLGLYYFITGYKKTTRLPIKGDGLS